MKKIVIIIGIVTLLLLSIITFKYNDIMYWYTHNFIEKDFAAINPNNYFLEDNYLYVNNYKQSEVFNRKQLLDFVYYFINSGVDRIDGYCNIDYTECIDDIEILSSDQESLSVLNNFVHPYNSFSSLEFVYNEKGSFTIKSNKLYKEADINAINKVVDNFIKESITKDMDTKTKIKTVHDYIISTTDYDKLKTTNIKDTTYKSQNAYGVLIEHYGICSGYSDTMAIFLNKLGVINYKISNKEHIWNLAFVDGHWYHIDLTWDDPITSTNTNHDNYFLITSKELNKLADKSHDYNKKIFMET